MQISRVVAFIRARIQAQSIDRLRLISMVEFEH
jgi:hypothetical protein